MSSGVLGRTRWLIALVAGVMLCMAPVCAAVTITQSGCGDNPPLEDLKPDLNVVRLEEGIHVDAPGGYTGSVPYSSGGFTLTAYYQNGEWMSFDWTSSTPVGAILVKSAQCWWIYEMTGSDQYGGVSFHSPCTYKDASNVWHIDWECTPANPPGKIRAVSHADFGFLSIPEFPTMACSLIGLVGVLGMVYLRKEKKD